MSPGSAGFPFLMRQTGLTAGNLSPHTSKLEAAGYIEVAGGVCGQKATYDAPADRCGHALELRAYRERMMLVLR